MTTHKNSMITLKEASETIGKSEVTIRRLVKKKKVTSRKVKSKTGFVYLVEKNSLLAYYNDDYSQIDQSPTHTTSPTTHEGDHPTIQTPTQATTQSDEKANTKEKDVTNQTTTQMTSQSIVNFLKDEMIRLRDDLKAEREKGEGQAKIRDEKISKLQEEMGQLRGQIGFWEGQAKAFEKQIKILQLQAPFMGKENEEPRKPDHIDIKKEEQAPMPDVITVQAVKTPVPAENPKDKVGESKEEEKEPIPESKQLNVVLWIVIMLILTGAASIGYAYLNGYLK